MTIRKILVASYSSEVVTLSFDLSTTPPSLTLLSTLQVGHHPSWITPHLSDKTVVFTATEEANGLVKALKYDLETGIGSIIAEASSGGADPCHLAIFEKDLLVANVRVEFPFPFFLSFFQISATFIPADYWLFFPRMNQQR